LAILLTFQEFEHFVVRMASRLERRLAISTALIPKGNVSLTSIAMVSHQADMKPKKEASRPLLADSCVPVEGSFGSFSVSLSVNTAQPLVIGLPWAVLPTLLQSMQICVQRQQNAPS
jgi:hypothetical protein